MLSVVILTKNEEKNIVACLESLSWCDEIFVIDDNSTDTTVELAKKLGVKVFIHALDNNFAAQRNFGLLKTNGSWVLFIDADEVVSEALASEISSAVADPISNEVNGYYIKRRDVMWGKELKHGEVGEIKVLRLAKKDSGRWHRKVHEVWEVKGEAGELQNPLLHFPHPTLAEFVSHIDFYSTLHAQQKFEDGERSSIFKIILWPKLKFIKNYVWGFGFLDGTQGFVLAMLMSFHSFLAWSKLWILQNKVTGNK